MVNDLLPRAGLGSGIVTQPLASDPAIGDLGIQNHSSRDGSLSRGLVIALCDLEREMLRDFPEAKNDVWKSPAAWPASRR
jgi:hypothetical protein